MKRILSLFLVLAVCIGLCACGGKEGGIKASSGLEVGFGRVNITPGYEMQMAGSAATRLASGYQDILYTTCIAFRENGEIYLVNTMDIIECGQSYIAPAKAAMSEKTGVPVENILMCATHTHSSVSMGSDTAKNAIKYRQEFYGWCAEAAAAAVEDLSHAQVWYGSVWAEGMAWVRHYKMADGTYAGANYGSFSSGIVGHASDADREMQLIKFARSEEGKKDIVMMNFPAHATMTSSGDTLSADFPSPTRDYIESNTGALVAYFIAAAGDQVPSSRVDTENFSSDYTVYGEELGHYAVEGLKNMTKLETTGMAHTMQTFTAGYNKEDLDRLDQALAVQEIWNKVGGRGTSEGKKAALSAGFSSVYQVTSILNRAKAPDTNSMDIHVMSIGDIGFIFAPYEMFGTQGMYIKENSPYPMTFIISCSEADEGYLPSALGWEIGCYESQITKFERGSAEKLAETYVEMLTAMKNG